MCQLNSLFYIPSGFSPNSGRADHPEKSSKYHSKAKAEHISQIYPAPRPLAMIINLLMKILKGGEPTRASAPTNSSRLVAGLPEHSFDMIQAAGAEFHQDISGSAEHERLDQAVIDRM